MRVKTRAVAVNAGLTLSVAETPAGAEGGPGEGEAESKASRPGFPSCPSRALKQHGKRVLLGQKKVILI